MTKEQDIKQYLLETKMRYKEQLIKDVEALLPEVYKGITYGVVFTSNDPILQAREDMDAKSIPHSLGKAIHNDDVGGHYNMQTDEIYLKAIGDEVTVLEYLTLIEILRHEIAHRIQFNRADEQNKDIYVIHGLEFQIACLELDLDPDKEAYDHELLVQSNTETGIYLRHSELALEHFDCLNLIKAL